MSADRSRSPSQQQQQQPGGRSTRRSCCFCFCRRCRSSRKTGRRNAAKSGQWRSGIFKSIHRLNARTPAVGRWLLLRQLPPTDGRVSRRMYEQCGYCFLIRANVRASVKLGGKLRILCVVVVNSILCVWCFNPVKTYDSSLSVCSKLKTVFISRGYRIRHSL